MSCPKNPKKFLFLQFNGGHDMQIRRIRAMLLDNVYEVDFECAKCKAREDTIMTHSRLVEVGFDAEKLSSMSGWDRPNFGKDAEDLR